LDKYKVYYSFLWDNKSEWVDTYQYINALDENDAMNKTKIHWVIKDYIC